MLWLSDLHLDGGDAAEDFSADDVLVEFLRFWHRRERIGLAGDTADLAQATLAEIERAHPRAAQAIEDYVTWLLIGNHDPVPQLFGHWTADAVLVRGVYVTHGSCFDPLNFGRYRFIGWAGAKAGGTLERVFGADADDWVTRRLGGLLSSGRFGDASAYRRRALSLMKRIPGAESIVIGHTHKRAVEPPYYNCGNWTGQDAGRRCDHILIGT